MPRAAPREQLLVVRLWEAQLAFEARLVEALAELGVTLAEFRLVGELLREPKGLRQRELARRLGVRPPTVSAAVARMMAAGLLTQVTDEGDQRARLVKVSDRATARAGFDVLAQLDAAATRRLSGRDRRELRRLLDCVMKGLTNGEAP